MGVELLELDVVDVLLVARLAEERLLVVHLREDPVRRRRGRTEHLSVVGILEFAKENFKLGNMVGFTKRLRKAFLIFCQRHMSWTALYYQKNTSSEPFLYFYCQRYCRGG